MLWWFCFLTDWTRFCWFHSRDPTTRLDMLLRTHYIHERDHRHLQLLVCFLCYWSRHLKLHLYDHGKFQCINQFRRPIICRYDQSSPLGNNLQWSQTDHMKARLSDPLVWINISLCKRPKFLLCYRKNLSIICHHQCWSEDSQFLLCDPTRWKFLNLFLHPRVSLCCPCCQSQLAFREDRKKDRQFPFYVLLEYGNTNQYWHPKSLLSCRMTLSLSYLYSKLLVKIN